ncbi:MAG: hypothetical protein HQ509_09840 [Candidatus Marinimicrobia bacterium]|nr:hypothetical protein [Candidatus Neomarinimicrobiota bacterium]
MKHKLIRTIRRPFEIIVIRYLLGAALLTPLFMWIFWFIQTPVPFSLFILDKSVLDNRAQEHCSISWVLAQEKITKSNGDLYDINQDYYGFFPLEGNRMFSIRDLGGWKEEKIDSLSAEYDGAYIAESYGVYRKDLIPEYTGQNKLLYGGLTNEEAYFLKKMVEQNKPVISEFNFIGTPTISSVRKEMEETFGIRWSGWVGRLMESLDTTKNLDIPEWLPNSYMEQNNGQWPFKGSGVIFVHTSGELFVMEHEKHLRIKTPVIQTRKNQRDVYGLPKVMEYPFWFDITFPTQTEHIVSYYTLYTTQLGDSLLASHGLPGSFPAVIHNPDVGGGFYYFAGDFADNPISTLSAYFKGVHWFQTFFYNPQDITDRRDFFWNYYRPLLTTIMKENI